MKKFTQKKMISLLLALVAIAGFVACSDFVGQYKDEYEGIYGEGGTYSEIAENESSSSEMLESNSSEKSQSSSSEKVASSSSEEKLSSSSVESSSSEDAKSSAAESSSSEEPQSSSSEETQSSSSVESSSSEDAKSSAVESSSSEDVSSSSSAPVESSSSLAYVSECKGNVIYEFFDGRTSDTKFGELVVYPSIVDKSSDNGLLKVSMTTSAKGWYGVEWKVPTKYGYDASSWNGLCITYSTTSNDLRLIVKSRVEPNVNFSVPLASTGGELQTVTFPWKDFASSDGDYSVGYNTWSKELFDVGVGVDLSSNQELSAEYKIFKVTTNSEVIAFPGSAINPTMKSLCGGTSLFSVKDGTILNEGSLVKNSITGTVSNNLEKGYASSYKVGSSVSSLGSGTVALNFSKKGQGQDISLWDGVCITYASNEPLSLTLFLQNYTSISDTIEVYEAKLPVRKRVAGASDSLLLPWSAFKKRSGANLTDSLVALRSIQRVAVRYDWTTSKAYAYFDIVKMSTIKNVSPVVEPNPFDTVSYGGYTYKTVKIGAQTWFAENLRYMSNSMKYLTDIACYTTNGNTTECLKKYGVFYTWETAMNCEGECSNTTSGMPRSKQGVCPSGWHVPDTTDFQILNTYIGSGASYKLASTDSWWTEENDGSQTVKGGDWYGFNAKPAGYFSYTEHKTEHFRTDFWTSNHIGKNNNEKYAPFVSINGDLVNRKTVFPIRNDNSKSDFRSVRCIKD